MESTYLSDPKYRAFLSSVEKAVKTFETTSEWADLISCLTKLNKVLQTSMQFVFLPKKVTITKRLAQCLHPALPSGVHIKALETYDLILNRIGTNGLAQDLFLFTSGLFPLLAHASIAVKPSLLDLYETHFVELGKELIPCLRGFVLALLPGLEEGSELFERNSALLVRVGQVSDSDLFFGAIWQAVLASAHVRLPAVNFLVSQVNKQLPASKQRHIIGDDIDRMVAAVSVAFHDENVLVLRSLLDLVLILFPFDQQFLTESNTIDVFTSALNVLIRRDMSLNRRFYTWTLGSNSSSDSSDDVTFENTYFESYTKRLLIQAVYNLLKQTNPVNTKESNRNMRHNLKPFRIVTALLERQELSSLFVDEILMKVLQSLQVCYHYWSVHETGIGMKSPRTLKRKVGGDEKGRKGDDVMKTVNLICGEFESGFIWWFMAEQMERVARHLSDNGEECGLSISELASLVQFLLDSLFVRSNDDISTVHVPTLLTHCLISLCLCCTSSSLQDLTVGFQLCSRLLSCCEPSAKLTNAPPVLLEKLKAVCGSQLQQLADCDLTSCCIEVAKICLVRFIESHLDLGGLLSGTGKPVDEQELVAAFEALCRLLIDVSSFPVLSEGNRIPENSTTACFTSERQWLQSLLQCITSNTSFPVFASATTMLLDLAAVGISYNVSQEESYASSVIIKPLITADDFHKIKNSGLLQTVVERLWHVLESDNVKWIELAATVVAQLSALRPCVDMLESTINDRLTSDSLLERRSALQTFSRLWELTEHGNVNALTPSFERPLFVMIESLHSSDPFSQQITVSWLSKLLQLGDVNRLLTPLLHVLLHPSTLRSCVTLGAKSGHWMTTKLLLYAQSYDTHRCRHALECLQSIVTSNTRGFISSAALSVISEHPGPGSNRSLRALLLKHEASIRDQHNKSTGDSSPVTRNFMETVLSVLLWFMQSCLPSSHTQLTNMIADESLVDDNALIQTMAARICCCMVEQLDVAFASSSSSMLTSGGYIQALFTLCGVHDVLLSCVATTLQQQLDKDACPQCLWAVDSSMALMVEMLKLTFSVLRLEYSQGLSSCLSDMAQSEWKVNDGQFGWHVLELCPLAQQPQLLALILHGLSSIENELIVHHFLQLFCNALPLFGVILPTVVQQVVTKLCTVLKRLTLKQSKVVVAALAHIMRFCLSKSDETVAVSHIGKRHFLLDFDGLTGMSPLVGHFVVSPVRDKDREAVDNAAIVCLSVLPRTLRSLLCVWKNMNESKHLPIAKQLREIIIHLLQLFTSVHDSVLLLSAGRLWSQLVSMDEVVDGNEWQLILLNMLKSIPAYPLDCLIKSAVKVLKESNDDDTISRVITFLQQVLLTSSSIELLSSWPEFYVYLKVVLPQVSAKPPDLFILVRSLHVFTAVIAACKEKKIRKEAQELTQKVLDSCCSVLAISLERKSWLGRSMVIRPSLLSTSDVIQSQPEIIDIKHELDLNTPKSPSGVSETAESDEVMQQEKETENEEVNSDDGKGNVPPTLSEYTIQALEVMSKSLAPLIDSMFGGEEKDRVVSMLTTVLTYVFPFLRCHSSVAASSYVAASALLSSVSEYQYTRKAWSKEAFELFLDAPFFKTDSCSLTSWLSIVDNMMTQDKNLFKELLSRSQTPVQGGLALFSTTDHGWGFCCPISLDSLDSLVFQPYVSRAVSGVRKRLTAARVDDGVVSQLVASLERLGTPIDHLPNSRENCKIENKCTILPSKLQLSKSLSEYEDTILSDFLEES